MRILKIIGSEIAIRIIVVLIGLTIAILGAFAPITTLAVLNKTTW